MPLSVAAFHNQNIRAINEVFHLDDCHAIVMDTFFIIMNQDYTHDFSVRRTTEKKNSGRNQRDD